jgi:3-dehydro-L-gulonate 2-dehydrogenase
MRIPFDRLQAEFYRVLLSIGATDGQAGGIATIFAQNSLDGVYSHGLDRFPGFVEYVQEKLVDLTACPVLEDQHGLLERYNGNLGPGMLNARFCMDRAIALAKEYGIGCVALRNTNHWMRGGTYGWQAADAGCIGICFTNTISIMPPWGGIHASLGNNPLVIAVPRSAGHVVLDMAMSQYSYGKMGQFRSRGEQLPFDGGFDQGGRLTRDPGTIIDNRSALPIGFWKGSGLAMMLDLLVTVLSKGRSTGEITALGKEYGVSQVFICIADNDEALRENIVSQVIEYSRTSGNKAGQKVSYPGKNTLRTRLENIELGIPVDETAWQKVLSL